MKLEEFLLFVESGELDRLEILAYIDHVTGNHKLDRLKALLEEVHYHTLNRKDQVEASYSDRINELEDQYIQQGKELPMKVIKFPKGGEEKILDTDKLLGGVITWDLYPLFDLQREIITKIKKATQVNSPHHQADTAHQQHPPTTITEFDFYYLLTDEGKKIYPIILELYTDVRLKKEYSIMLVVLSELGYLIYKHLTGQKELHRALETTFKKVGTRQLLVKYISNYSESNASAIERQEVDRHKQRLLDAIKNKTNLSANN
ncbi:hypothetical protein H9Q13_14375 [Pontibacter sp. JH31]|uniref:Uncharacterized protein n=1 Tax=Pontibacter aquaedesilientis TaxID=2766980 RepID=A0ABR7XJ85_9BACT|nr:hypothetical protein [Pontibacter aquaedesilientis]MBD1398354.1 hypothetical protein [Pontibacter aquaedesilientis]